MALSVIPTSKQTITQPLNKLELTMLHGVFMLGEATNHIKFLLSVLLTSMWHLLVYVATIQQLRKVGLD